MQYAIPSCYIYASYWQVKEPRILPVTFHHGRYGSGIFWGSILGMPVCRELLLSLEVKAFNQCVAVITPDEAIVGGNAVR